MNGGEQEFRKDDRVGHAKLGEGLVVADNGATVVVRFDRGIEECERGELVRRLEPLEAMASSQWANPLETVARTQAEAIRSVNDVWGVFARSKIELLPHQLWVCRQVLSTQPARWLVADDVGLGKTVEAGLILAALASRGGLGRLLVLCPASLVEQWQQRMLDMFDIRLARYHSEADTEKANFWAIHSQVIASLQTLRADSKGRHERLVEGGVWDTVIVDEAHHLNADEDAGPTQGYKLIAKLVEHQLVRSMVFFTGTPHRGKNYGFLSLLNLLRPDLFDPSRGVAAQLPSLSQAVIRNNKYNVTDLEGRKLFQEPLVHAEEYGYSTAEAAFYDMLTEFIVSGKAYASRMSDATQGRAVMLVLIAMQKLASSSVAAIRRAIRGRLARIGRARGELDRLNGSKRVLAEYAEAEALGELDLLSQLEERITECDVELRLMADEERRLRELLEASERVVEETKIRQVVNLVRSQYSGRSVLFFTEYKATQSLLMSALMQAFGRDSVAFINGDARAEDVVTKAGEMPRLISEARTDAAERFNEGKVRFLVSTEAAGEGIDLQEHCHTLFHIDLPWNPMRMHQRVGRLNRFGQKERVEVVVVHNPQTVESRIWQKLTEKIEEINRAMANVMEHPEDLGQLVLGAAPSSLYRDLFAQASGVPRERLSAWFDEKTSRIGGRDTFEVVRELVGSCARFDFRQSSALIPRVDLPDLEPFVTNVLQLNRRRPQREGDGLSFKTPDSWRSDPTVRANYSGLLFDRHAATRRERGRVVGAGHAVFEHSMRQALAIDAPAAAVAAGDGVAGPLFVYRVTDRVTSERSWVRGVTVAVRVSADVGECELLHDWQLLQLLNGLKLSMREEGRGGPDVHAEAAKLLTAATAFIEARCSNLPVAFRHARVSLVATLWLNRASS